MLLRAIALTLLTTFAVPAVPAFAEEPTAASASAVTVSASATTNVGLITPKAMRPRAERGILLPSLYVSLGALQAFDVYSTLSGLQQGAVESNQLMKGVTQNPAAFVALKAGVTGVSIYAAEQLWRNKRKKSAILLMVASNGLMAYVAHNNSRVLGGLR